jgi:hypothetical protein
MLDVNSVEQEVRKYAEEPAISRSDNCECKKKISAVADMLNKVVTKKKDAKKSKPENTSGRRPKWTVKPKQKQAAGRGIVPKMMARNRKEAGG